MNRELDALRNFINMHFIMRETRLHVQSWPRGPLTIRSFLTWFDSFQITSDWRLYPRLVAGKQKRRGVLRSHPSPPLPGNDPRCSRRSEPITASIVLWLPDASLDKHSSGARITPGSPLNSSLNHAPGLSASPDSTHFFLIVIIDSRR